MAWSNTPGDPVAQRQRELAEEEKRLAEEASRLRRELEANAEGAAAEAVASRRLRDNPGMGDEAEEPPAPVLRHSAARRRDRAKFFALLFALFLVILWIVRVLS